MHQPNSIPFSHETLLDLSGDLLETQYGIKLRVGGYSMFPFLKPGDIAVIHKTPISDLSIGDVLVFKRSKGWIAHRLLKKTISNNSTELITKGDSCLKRDEIIREEMYVGKVVSFSRKEKMIDINRKGRYLYSLFILNTSRVSAFLLHLIVRVILWSRQIIYFLKK